MNSFFFLCLSITLKARLCASPASYRIQIYLHTTLPPGKALPASPNKLLSK